MLTQDICLGKTWKSIIGGPIFYLNQLDLRKVVEISLIQPTNASNKLYRALLLEPDEYYQTPYSVVDSVVYSVSA